MSSTAGPRDLMKAGSVFVDRSRLPPLAPVPPFAFPTVTRSTLANGLRVWTARHAVVPMTGLLLLVRRGASSDPAGREGLAALTVDMLDEGVGSLSAIEIHQELARLGAQLDTDVGADAMMIGLTSLSRFTGRALAFLADIVVRPALREDDFTRVRQQRLHRLVQLRDMPGVIAERAFAKLLFGRTPYGHTPLGNETSLGAMTIDDVRGFHRRVMRPEDATLVAVGDLDHDTIRSLAERAFGDWTGSGDHLSAPPSELPHPARLNVVTRPGPQSELRIGHVGVSRSTPDYHALVAANMVLGGQYVSRINLNLRAEKGITYGVRTAFEFRRSPGPFMLSVSVDKAATALAIAESFKEISDIREARPVTADELAVGVAALTRGYAKNFETFDQVARAVAQLSLFDLPESFYTEFVPCIEALTPEDVSSAAARHLDPSRLTTLVVGDVDTTSQEFGRLGLGAATLVSPDSI